MNPILSLVFFSEFKTLSLAVYCARESEFLAMIGSLRGKPLYHVCYAATYCILRQVCDLILLVGQLITIIPEVCEDGIFIIVSKITLA